MIASLDFKEFGKEVARIRKEARYSQKRVNQLTGISEDTVRRIEKGLVIPKYETIELLSGLYKVNLVKLLNDYRKDSRMTFLSRHFDQVLILPPQQRKEALKQLNREAIAYDTKAPVNPSEVELIRILFDATARVCARTDIDYEVLIRELERAMAQTVPGFCWSEFASFRYSELEMRILLLAGLIHHRMDDHQKAIPLLEFCLEYLNFTLEEDSLASLQMKIKLCYNLSYACYKTKSDEKSLEYAELGLNLCKNHKVHYVMDLLLARKGVAQYYLKRPGYEDTFRQAIHLLKATQDEELLDYLIQSTKEAHGIDLAPMAGAVP